MNDKLKNFIQLTALSIILVSLSGFIPVAGIILLFLSVVPQLILITKRRQYLYSIFSWLLVFFFIGLLKGWGFSSNYIFLFFIYALWFSYLIKRPRKPYIVIVNAAVIWCLLIFMWTGLNYIFFKINLLEEIVKLAKISAAFSIGKYYDFGLQYSQIEMMDNSINGIIEFFTKSAVGWVLITGLIGSWFVYYTLGRYIYMPELPPIKKFRLSEGYIWFLIFAVILYVFGGKLSGDNMPIVLALNIGVVLLGGYFLSGFGLIISLMARWNFSMFMKFLAIFFLFIFLRGIYFFIIFGIVDVWVNFRKRWQSNKN